MSIESLDGPPGEDERSGGVITDSEILCKLASFMSISYPIPLPLNVVSNCVENSERLGVGKAGLITVRHVYKRSGQSMQTFYQCESFGTSLQLGLRSEKSHEQASC